MIHQPRNKVSRSRRRWVSLHHTQHGPRGWRMADAIGDSNSHSDLNSDFSSWALAFGGSTDSTRSWTWMDLEWSRRWHEYLLSIGTYCVDRHLPMWYSAFVPNYPLVASATPTPDSVLQTPVLAPKPSPTVRSPGCGEEDAISVPVCPSIQPHPETLSLNRAASFAARTPALAP